ncbi:hypothetical protein [Nocardia higoensis]|uniref:hypothetical protein n=1 Tax=Nocardia higoensis TaxID=228599 RepID=UPI0012F6C57E|nr:hypothetical protein [Nocardia higoensis]
MWQSEQTHDVATSSAGRGYAARAARGNTEKEFDGRPGGSRLLETAARLVVVRGCRIRGVREEAVQTCAATEQFMRLNGGSSQSLDEIRFGSNQVDR